jgi:hypothetical protein
MFIVQYTVDKLEKTDKTNEKEKLEKTKDKKIAKTETRDEDFFKKRIDKKKVKKRENAKWASLLIESALRVCLGCLK